MTSLTDRLRQHAQLHQQCTVQDDEQKTFAEDLLAAAAEIERLSTVVVRKEAEAKLATQPAMAEPLTDAQISGAVARGWCHPRNKFKVMDPDIAIAIAAEVSALIDAHGIGIKGSAA